jgi:hypothetical protein
MMNSGCGSSFEGQSLHLFGGTEDNHNNPINIPDLRGGVSNSRLPKLTARVVTTSQRRQALPLRCKNWNV